MRNDSSHPTLPGLDCGLCGFRTCQDLALNLPSDPGLLKRCVMLAEHVANVTTSGATALAPSARKTTPSFPHHTREECASCGLGRAEPDEPPVGEDEWKDSLGREFDFFLEHLPEDPGPREVILPHNPMLTRELGIQVGDVMIGRPLGMSCGCPVTHCGVVKAVDMRTGVITWCVTGPLRPRQEGFKDIGYYSAEAYEGLVTRSRKEIKIGLRFFFQPRMCMLQWRHSGLVNAISRTKEGLRIRLEGLFIG